MRKNRQAACWDAQERRNDKLFKDLVIGIKLTGREVLMCDY
jgi:hypothetical protein